MTKDSSTRNLKHKLAYHDHNSMDFDKNDSSVQQATIDKATSYCQLCFDKSIEWFQINECESITLCLNPDCSTPNRITYDTNNNRSGTADGEAKKFKYSKEILDMTAAELQTFFEKDIETISSYKKLQNVLDTLSHPKYSDKTPVLDSVVVQEAPKEQETAPMSQEPNVISQSDNLILESFNFVDNSNSMPSIGATVSDQYFNYDSTLVAQQMPILQQQQLFELPVFNQSESQTTGSTIPASTFDDDFLALLNEDLTFTDMTKTYTNNSTNSYQAVDVNNSVTSFNGNSTFNQELPMINETSDLTELKNINQTDFMLEFQGDINLLSGNSNSLTSPVKNANPTASNKLMDQSFDVIKDIGLKSGSRIKITKKKKKTAKQSMFDMEDEGDQESNQDDKTTAKYDSIGENEDSSDHLLPWEVKSTKKKKESSYQKRISNLGLMSMSRNSPNKKPVSQQSSPAANIMIPTNVTRADLSMKTSQASSIGSTVSLKKALSETSENNFQAELEKTSKISHLFNKSSILKPPGGAGAGGYKDLVLNVLKKKTQA